MITELTPAQTRRMEALRDEWLAIGRGCERLDRGAVKGVATEVYKAFGKSAPIVFFFDSPLTCVLGREFLRANLGANLRANLRANLGDKMGDDLRDNLRDNLRANLGANLGANLRANLWENLRANLRDNLRDNLWENLWDNLGDNLGANLWANLGDNLRDNLWENLGANLRDNLWANLWENLRENLRDNLWATLRDNLWANLRDNLRGNLDIEDYFGGQHLCAWEVFFDFCGEIGVPYAQKDRSLLDLWLRQSKSCHWWWPYEGVVFASERHSVCRVNERGRLHCDNGMACGYADGWGVWAINGVRVPRMVVENPQSLKPEQIENEKNAEVRRVMLERFGWSRFIQESGAKEIQRDDWGKLYRKELPGDEPLVMVKVTNSTPEHDGSFKDYFLRVPPNIARARDAVAWTFEQAPGEYQLAEQT